MVRAAIAINAKSILGNWYVSSFGCSSVLSDSRLKIALDYLGLDMPVENDKFRGSLQERVNKALTQCKL